MIWDLVMWFEIWQRDSNLFWPNDMFYFNRMEWMGNEWRSCRELVLVSQ